MFARITVLFSADGVIKLNERRTFSDLGRGNLFQRLYSLVFILSFPPCSLRVYHGFAPLSFSYRYSSDSLRQEKAQVLTFLFPHPCFKRKWGLFIWLLSAWLGPIQTRRVATDVILSDLSVVPKEVGVLVCLKLRLFDWGVVTFFSSSFVFLCFLEAVTKHTLIIIVLIRLHYVLVNLETYPTVVLDWILEACFGNFLSAAFVIKFIGECLRNFLVCWLNFCSLFTMTTPCVRRLFFQRSNGNCSPIKKVGFVCQIKLFQKFIILSCFFLRLKGFILSHPLEGTWILPLSLIARRAPHHTILDSVFVGNGWWIKGKNRFFQLLSALNVNETSAITLSCVD